MTGPQHDDETQYLIIQVDASSLVREEPPPVVPPRPSLLRRHRYWLYALVVIGLLAGAAYGLGAATYDPPSRLPELAFHTEDPLFGFNAAVLLELEHVREAFTGPDALDLEPAGPVFELPLPRTVADRLWGRRDESATVFSVTNPNGEFRFLLLAEGESSRIVAIEAPLGLSPRNRPTGIFLALDEADPVFGPIALAVEALLPELGQLESRVLSPGDLSILGPYQGGDLERLEAQIASNIVMRHLTEEIAAANGDVSMAAPVFMILGNPGPGTINAVYHPQRRLIMEPLWASSSTATLAHELVHAYFDTVVADKRPILAMAAGYLEQAHPVLHGQVVGHLYQRLGREARAEESLAFIAGAIAAEQTKTVATADLLQNPGNVALSEAILYSDIELLIEIGLLPACMRPGDARGEITPAYYTAAASACDSGF